jgi:hypothetical protein
MIGTNLALDSFGFSAGQFRRGSLRRVGHQFYAQEANLNLMSSNDLRNAARDAGIASFHIETVRLGPWSSNLLLIATKYSTAIPPTPRQD